MLRRAALCMACLLASAGVSGACPQTTGWIEMNATTPGTMTGSMQLPTEAAPVSEPFDIEIWFCDASPPDQINVSAIMPAHQHGMNYHPAITQTGENTFTSKGMLFHMPGAWRITVTAITSTGPQHFELDVLAK